jgi:hypothetical protein
VPSPQESGLIKFLSRLETWKWKLQDAKMSPWS